MEKRDTQRHVRRVIGGAPAEEQLVVSFVGQQVESVEHRRGRGDSQHATRPGQVSRPVHPDEAGCDARPPQRREEPDFGNTPRRTETTQVVKFGFESRRQETARAQCAVHVSSSVRAHAAGELTNQSQL
jgi:hypothetical protein